MGSVEITESDRSKRDSEAHRSTSTQLAYSRGLPMHKTRNMVFKAKLIQIYVSSILLSFPLFGDWELP